MKIAMLAPIAWRTPPRHYGPWELVTHLLTEALVARGIDVTLFATLDSITAGTLDGVVPAPYSEDPGVDAKVWEHRHLSQPSEPGVERRDRALRRDVRAAEHEPREVDGEEPRAVQYVRGAVPSIRARSTPNPSSRRATPSDVTHRAPAVAGSRLSCRIVSAPRWS